MIFVGVTLLFFLIVFHVLGYLPEMLLSSLLKRKYCPSFFDYCWLGCAHLIVVLMTMHFVLPIERYGQAYVYVATLASLIVGRERARHFVGHVRQFRLAQLALAVLIIGVSLGFVCYLAVQNIDAYDTYLYHLNVVDWNKLHPVVHGLANLHMRMGVNSAFHVLAAFFDHSYYSHFWQARSAHIALAFLHFVFLAQCLFHFFFGPKDNALNIFCAVCVVALFKLDYLDVDMSSLSPDSAVAVFGLACGYYLMRAQKLALSKWEHQDHETQLALVFAATLGSLALATKISAAAIWLSTLLLLVFLLRGKVTWRTRLGVFLFPILFSILIPLTNIYISGWPFFPATILPAPVPWRADIYRVKESIIWVHCFVLGCNPVDYIQQGPWHWAFKYIGTRWLTWQYVMVYIGTPLVIGKFLWDVSRKSSVVKYVYPIALMITLAGLAFWQLTGRAARFGEYLWWEFFGIAAASLFASCKHSKALRSAAAGILVVAIGYIVFAYKAPNRRPLTGLFTFIPEPPASMPTKVKVIHGDDGVDFEVLIPTNDDRCGRSDLPCTPESDDGIRIRRPGDNKSGFLPALRPKHYRWMDFYDGAPGT